MVDQVDSDSEVAVSAEDSIVPGEEHYKIVNTVRSRHNRVQRMLHPTHARLKQHIGGEFRVIRGRPLVLSQSTVERHMGDIKEKIAAGLIQLQTMDGRVIDPNTFDIPDVSLPPALPHVRPDSAANDKNIGIGENIPQMPGGIPVAQVTAGNTTSGGIPGPLENEGKHSSADPAAGGEDPSDEIDDPAGG